MIVFASRFLTRGEVWFDDEPDETQAVDWIQFNQRSTPVPGAQGRPFYNYLIDLMRSTEQLQGRLNDDTAYKIRRARERDKIVCEVGNPRDPALLDQFERLYNEFAAARGLQTLERRRVNSMTAADRLDLSVAKDPQGNVLVFHGNYRDARRATNIYSASLYRSVSDSSLRNLIGRANRYLVWSDLLRYRAQGLKAFDFGGWYPGTTDQALLKINEFKRGFGGEVVREYECEQVRTLKGRLVLLAAKWLQRATPPPAGHEQSPVPATPAVAPAGPAA